MGDYLTTLEGLLTRTKRSVDVVCPFVDDTGAAVLAAAYDRGTRTARWRIYVRKAPDALLVAARRRRWQVYEYVGTPGGEERRGFHCKLFIVDEIEAVVGSANLIYQNLVENVEIGVHLEGPTEVGPLLQVPRSLARASRQLILS